MSDRPLLTEDACRVLVVDDNPQNVLLAETLLKAQGYVVSRAFDGVGALAAVAQESPDLILLDVMMPGLDGFVVTRQLKGSEGTRHIPIVLLTSLQATQDRVKGIEAGADDFISKPFDRYELLARVRSLIRVKRSIDELESAERVILALSRAIEARDAYTEQHTERVASRAVALGSYLGLGDNALRVLYQGGLLHDIGKIGIPEAILGKPGRLSDEEFVVMRRHPMLGVEICYPLRSSVVAQALPIVRHHHENIDGTGYPDGLRGEDIPLLARITAISDAYDAMTSDRPYRRGLPLETALEILQGGSGQQWDRDLVAAFNRLSPAILGPAGREVAATDGGSVSAL